MPAEYLHHAELFVCDTHYADMALFGQAGFYSFYMYIRIFFTAAMAHVDTELKHLEAIGQHILTEFCVVLAVGFCLSGQVEKY